MFGSPGGVFSSSVGSSVGVTATGGVVGGGEGGSDDGSKEEVDSSKEADGKADVASGKAAVGAGDQRSVGASVSEIVRSKVYMTVRFSTPDGSDDLTQRVVIELFDDVTPRTARNFRMLCSGEKVRGGGRWMA